MFDIVANCFRWISGRPSRPLARPRPRRSANSSLPALVSLEDRHLLTTFGTPWPEARTLSVSLPSDQAAVGAYDNSLRSVLDKVADRQVWQTAIMHAFQTWSLHANINVGLVPDRGDDLGTPGLTNNDPRFGEFRVAAIPQTRVLANSLPYQPVAGSWSGDILLNTQTNFFLGDYQSGLPIAVPAANERGPAVELYSVLLHEVGNALGLADNNTPGSVMNGTYSGPRTKLSTGDITAIQKLYGVRTDPYEATSNDALSRATRVTPPAGQLLTGVQGSLKTRQDVDLYRIRLQPGQQKATVRLQADGISLLKGRLEVLDLSGKKLTDVKADSLFENNLQVEIGSLDKYTEIYVKVASNSTDAFGAGDYRLEIDYRSPEQQPNAPATHDADAEDEDGNSVSYLSLDQIFSTAGLIDKESTANNTLNTAAALTMPPGFLANTRFEAQSSIASATDRDFWKMTMPATIGGPLTITVNPVGFESLLLDVMILNAAGDRVAARHTISRDGSHSFVIDQPKAGANYVIGIQRAAASTANQGNYLISADVATDKAILNQITQGTVRNDTEQFSQLNVVKSQLFRFDLKSLSSVADGAQVTIYDERTRTPVFMLATRGATSNSGYVWLSEGNYILRFTYLPQTETRLGSTSYQFFGDAISDDQGPLPLDPTMPGTIPNYPWVYDPAPPPTNTIIDYPIPIYNDPWLIDPAHTLQLYFYTYYYT